MLYKTNSYLNKQVSLRWKLITPIISLGFIAVIAFTLIITHTLLNKLTIQQVENSKQITRAVYQIFDKISDPIELKIIIEAIAQYREITLILAVDKESNKIIATNQEVWLGKTITFLKSNHSAKSLLKDWITHFEQLSAFCENNVVSTINSNSNDTLYCSPKNSIFISTDASIIRQFIYTVEKLILIWGFILVTVVVYLVYLLFNHVVLHPIKLIEQTISQRSHGNKAVYIPLVSHDEIGTMANTLNIMLNMLDHSQAETKKLALVAKNTDNVVIISDHLGKIEWVNDGFTRVTGYTLDEVLNKKPGAILQGPATDPRTIKMIHQGLQSGRGFQVEILNYKKDGTEFWLAMEIQPICDETRYITQYIAIERDITKQKQAELALLESEKRYQNLTELSPIGIFHADIQGNCTYVNKRLQQITGITMEQAINQQWFNAIYPDDRNNVLRAWIRTVKHEQPFEAEFRFQIQPNKITWVFGQAVPEYNNQNYIIGFIGTLVDITERKQVEVVLRQAEERFRTLVEASSDWVWEIDAQGIYTYVSPKVTHILGYMPDEIIGKTPFDLMLPAEAVRVKSIFTDISNNCKPFEYLENNVIHKNGHIIICESSGIPVFDIDNRLTGYRGIDRDITLRHKTYELSLANAELARTSRLKDEFLANMSHELRTPLNAILALSEGLQEQVYGPLNDKQLKFLHSIETSGRHLLTLINDILNLSKIEAGKLELDIETVILKEICQASLEFVKHMAYKKRIKIYSYFNHLNESIQADERCLKQVLVNLLSNAVKFTEEGGEIGLKTELNKITKVVKITVWDTGIGIAEANKSILFKPFVQIDSSLARRHGGTGLGLALVRRLTEKHNGTISVESTLGEGSQFIISLPWLESTENKIDDKNKYYLSNHSDGNDHYHPLILLAEDNQENINAISSYLQLKGYRLMLARNGLEAVEQACRTIPDIILMDIQMPVMNGLDAIKQIRTYSDLINIPIIALTALAMPGDSERCLSIGATQYISKPVDLKELIHTIEIVRLKN